MKYLKKIKISKINTKVVNKDVVGGTDFYVFLWLQNGPAWQHPLLNYQKEAIQATQMRWAGAGLGFRKNNQRKMGSGRRFSCWRPREWGRKACLASEVGTARPGPWLWENASGLWATGWCNLDYVPGYTANLLTYSLTQLKMLGATYYPWLNKSLSDWNSQFAIVSN